MFRIAIEDIFLLVIDGFDTLILPRSGPFSIRLSSVSNKSCNYSNYADFSRNHRIAVNNSGLVSIIIFLISRMFVKKGLHTGPLSEGEADD